jgi:hypothetical protein
MKKDRRWDEDETRFVPFQKKMKLHETSIGDKKFHFISYTTNETK